MLATRLRDYPLYPYLLRSDLLARLDTASDKELTAFFQQYDGEPFTRLLRSSWLRHLSSRRRWRAFLRDYQGDHGVALACKSLEARYRTGAAKAALDGVPELWLHGYSRPDTCDPIFDLWVKAGRVTSELAWQRIGLSLETGQTKMARYLRRFVPASQRRYVDQWIAVQENPRALLRTDTISRDNPYTARIVLHGLDNWSRYDSPAAAQALTTLKKRFDLPKDGVQQLERRLALFLASRGHPDAERRLAAVPAGLADEAVRAWRVRTAMRARDWPKVLDRIDAMPESEQQALRWQYWRARAWDELGSSDKARVIYRELATNRDYHGFLAADRLGLDYQFEHHPLQVDQDSLNAERAASGVRRSQELFKLGRIQDARREWWHHFADGDQNRWLAATRIAADWGWSSEAIASAAKAKDWNDLEVRFPLEYRSKILSSARREGIEPEWVYAILRQESIFRTDARSGAGALGLMQIMPATAKLIARDLQVPYRGNRQLLDPGANIRLGARYLKMSREELDNRALLATAGYNAGPHRVVKWLPKDQPMPADLWIELVPFSETRKYLRRVLEYSVIYQHRLELKPGFLERQMAPIPARNSIKSS
jgi:soluble lytic murein transglycosylase